MKIDSKGYVTLTPRESAEIIECLETLEAMSGAYDEDFTRDCQTAGRYSNRLLNLKISLIDKKIK